MAEMKFDPKKTLPGDHTLVDNESESNKYNKYVYLNKFNGLVLSQNETREAFQIIRPQKFQQSGPSPSQQQLLSHEQLVSQQQLFSRIQPFSQQQQLTEQPSTSQLIIPQRPFFQMKQHINLQNNLQLNNLTLEATFVFQNSFESSVQYVHDSNRTSTNNNNISHIIDNQSLYASQLKFPEMTVDSNGDNSCFSSNDFEEFPNKLNSKKFLKKIFQKRNLFNMQGKTKRSRMGCLTCRGRKKRCCERRPKCSECDRLGLKCNWPIPGMENKNKPRNNNILNDGLINSPFGKIKVLRGIVSKK